MTITDDLIILTPEEVMEIFTRWESKVRLNPDSYQDRAEMVVQSAADIGCASTKYFFDLAREIAEQP